MSGMQATDEVKLDFSLCIICQTNNGQDLVEKPISHEKVVKSIEEWAKYGNLSYVEVWKKLQGTSLLELENKQASWHRSCYKETVHNGMLKRAKQKYERQLAGPDESRRKSRDSMAESSQLTRSKTTPYNKEACFFCDGQAGYRKNLHNVSTFSAGESLRSAIKRSGNAKLAVKLNTSIADNDAHSIDIKYHKLCWVNNVTNVLRKTTEGSTSRDILASEVAAEVEFLTMTEMTLRSGNIPTMSDLQDAFESILEANNVANPKFGRKALKQLLLREIPGIEFHAPKRVNESERVSIKKSRDAAVQMAEDQAASMDFEMKSLFDAAAILRKSICKCKKWKFTGSLENISVENIPLELFSFYRWVIQGVNNELTVDRKSDEVYRRAMNLCQTTVSMLLTERQVKNKKSDALRTTNEMPQQLGVGLAVHQAARSKELINMLHGFGMSVDYNRVLRVEAQIESTVLERMIQNDGLYIPPDVIMGRHVFFAVDNVDFSEDTPDGKNTFHGTAMAIYQRCQPGDKEPELIVDSADPHSRRSIRELPESVTSLLECPEPPSKPIGRSYPQFGLFSVEQLPITIRKEDFAWLLSRSLTRTVSEENAPEDVHSRSTDVPVWSGYNSMISERMPLTRVGTPPLVAAPAHEWQTLLTVLMQAQNINAKVMGPNRKTVISLDLGLYQPAKKLQLIRQDLRHLILRPGELHIVMAQLRSLGAFIENSGLDICWIESDLYGPATVKQIIGGNHVKRGETAHMVTLQALFDLYQQAFFQKYPNLRICFKESTEQLREACLSGITEQVKIRHGGLVQAITSKEMIEKMEEFDKRQENVPLFKFARHYMNMVMEMLSFIKAVRTGNWDLHLDALEVFTKYFFAHDMLNYARMVPVYLAEMRVLHETDPEIFQEFQQGNWVVNKNANVSFCAVGADNALEHVNRSMKVSGGLVGITLNPVARTKYFLIAPELARLAERAKEMAGTSTQIPKHHSFTTAVQSCHEKNIEQLVTTMQRFTNPFSEESTDLYNFVTKVVIPENVKKDVGEQSIIGKGLFGKFVEERIKTTKLSIWAPMKKRKLRTWKTVGKTVRVESQGKIIELKEDRALFARMMVVCKARPEIDIKEAVGVYEFSVVPRSMFSADGTMLHCSSKSDLMDILEKLPERPAAQDETGEMMVDAGMQMKVSIVDGMAELQALDKPDWVKTCCQFADHFTATLFTKYRSSNELRLIFDRLVHQISCIKRFD